MITRNRAGLALAFVLAGVTLIGGPMAIASAIDTPARTTSTATPTPSGTTPSQTIPPETTEPTEPEYSEPTEPTSADDFTGEQDAWFIIDLEDSLPTLTATVPSTTLIDTAHETAYAMSAKGVSKAQVAILFQEHMTGYDVSDGLHFAQAVEDAYLT